MFKVHQITHVRKDKSYQNCKCITDVKTSDKKVYSISEVISLMTGGIKNQHPHKFFIQVNSQHLEVNAVPENEPCYIRTERDDGPYDNILSLPSF